MMNKTAVKTALFALAAAICLYLLSPIFPAPLSSALQPIISASAARAGNRAHTAETIIVSARADSYYPLAQKIAQAEDLPIIGDFAEALEHSPRYILLVAAPSSLTQEVFSDISAQLNRLDGYPALGIITGSSIEKAEALYVRRAQARLGRSYMAGDIEITQRVPGPTIYDISSAADAEGAVPETALTKDTLTAALSDADYFYWSRHVGGRSWFWNSESADFSEQDELRVRDIPALKPVVIYTPSCGSVRPWVENNIAMGFVEQGAAAYIGNANPPFTNAFIKRGLAVQGLASWAEFPLGLVAQVHSKSFAHTVFTAPQFFMLGDPRIALAQEPPYQVISDTVQPNGQRVIAGQSAINGVLAIKIEDGAAYPFLTAQGITSASDQDVTYNSKLQMMDLGADKYVLLLHPGGPFTLTLSPAAPFLWTVTDAVLDAFDYAWVVLWLDVKIIYSPSVFLIPLVLFLLILFVQVIRPRKPLAAFTPIFLAALLITLLRLVYFLTRWDAYTVSANYADYSALQIALGLAGEFACVSGGLILLKESQKRLVKFLGLVFGVFPQFLLTAFYLVFLTFYNVMTPMTGFTASWLISYHLFWLLSLVLAGQLALLVLAHRVTRGRVGA